MSLFRRKLLAKRGGGESGNLATVTDGKCLFSTPRPRNWFPLGVKAKIEAGKEYNVSFHWKLTVNEFSADNTVTENVTINCKYAQTYQVGGFWGIKPTDVGQVMDFDYTGKIKAKQSQDGTDEWFLETLVYKPKIGDFEGILEIFDLVVTEVV